MPKQDRFAAQKNEANKNRKKLNDAKKQEAKLAAAEEEEEPEPPARTGSAPNSGKQPKTQKSDTTFAKAAAYVAGDDEEEEEAAEVEEEEVREAASSKAKKETKADQKKQQATRRQTEFELLEEQERLASKERMKDRFLRILIVGVIMELWQGQNGATNGHHGVDKKEKKEKKAKKREADSEGFSFRSAKEKMDLLSGPFLMFIVIFAVLYGKAMEDGYSPGEFDQAANFYDVMGIPRDSGIMDVRKKYKSLALNWHPDKNPDCTTCVEKFAAISKAYEVLSDPEQKKLYDTKRAAKGSLSSMVSVELTKDDFEAKVLRSNDVWYVQVYDPQDGASGGFHPIWEHGAGQLQHAAKFGRIDMSKNKKAAEYLPQRVVIMPVVFRFASGLMPENFLWSGASSEYEGEDSSRELTRFVADTFPVMKRAENADELKTWWTGTGKPRLLFSGNGNVIRRGAGNEKFMTIMRQAHLWSEFFDVLAADSKDARKLLGDKIPSDDKKGARMWSVAWKDEKGEVKTVSTDEIKEMPDKIEEVVQQALATQAPQLTVRNHQQLCGAGTSSRTFCLFIVDASSESQVSQILADVASSHSDYRKEVEDMRDSDQEVSEEPFRIQPVRVMTGTSRFPSQPVSVGSAFYPVWKEVGHAPMFLLSLETGRVAAVKTSILKSLHQQVAYEDLKFQELPEGVAVARGLPDPEESFKRVLFRVLTTPFGGLLAYVLLAAIYAVAPELPLMVNLGALGSFSVLVLLVWPFACRKFLATLLFQ